MNIICLITLIGTNGLSYQTSLKGTLITQGHTMHVVDFSKSVRNKKIEHQAEYGAVLVSKESCERI
jgi:hypothetical protein